MSLPLHTRTTINKDKHSSNVAKNGNYSALYNIGNYYIHKQNPILISYWIVQITWHAAVGRYMSRACHVEANH